ncbi:MAG: heme biosynthesis HemY N-terminal domain-containing protein [Formivibrio sp.]|nr:heme biosynthesis HemY N-terminal domain-containing protein [Formivibrio sp.]
MKTLLWLIGLFSLAVGLTLFAQINTGYALLFMPPWRVELSLNVFIIVLTVFVTVLYFGLRIVAELTGLPGRVRAYRNRRRANAGLKIERDALIAFAEGRYQRAEKMATEAMSMCRNDEAFAVNALLAARAAHLIRDFERRDHHFESLRQRLGPSHLATAMTMAELLLDEHRFGEASMALEEARAISPKLTAALRLELRLRQAEGNPDAVLKLIEQLARAEALDEEQVRRLRVHACLQKLRQQQMTVRELAEWWRRLPVEDRAHPQLVQALAESYDSLGEPDLAGAAIEAALEISWSSELSDKYGTLKLEGEALEKQLAKAESWLAQHPDDHRLLLTLGRLCRARALWGKAQNYLEASIAVEPTAVAHAELGQLCEQLERNNEANRHYRASLGLALAH